VSTSKSYTQAFLAFAVLAFGLTALMQLDFRPRPIYGKLSPTGQPVSEEFRQGEAVEFSFRAPGDDLNGFYFPDLVWNEKHAVEIQVENLTARRAIAQQLLTFESPQPQFDGANAVGDRIRVQLRWKRDAEPVLAPEITMRDGGGATHTIAQPLTSLERDVPVNFEFEAPAADLTEFEIEGLLTDLEARVQIEIENLTTGVFLKKFTADKGQPAKRSFKPKNAAGDRIKISFKWQKHPAPALLGSALEPQPETEFEGVPAAFLTSYDSWSHRLNWLWAPAGLLALLALRNGRLSSIALVAAGLAALATSVLSWQQAYGVLGSHMDPDRFGEFGTMLADWVRDPGSRPLTELFLSEWRYSWLPLTPILTATLQLLGASPLFSAVIVAALASFGSVLLVHSLLRRSFGLSDVSAFAGALLFLTHHFFLKSFAKPSTDPVGLLLVLASIVLLADRIRRPATRGKTIGLAVIIFLHFLARPLGAAFAAATAGVAILADWLRTKKFDFVSSCWTGVLTGIVPLAIVSAIFYTFGWLDNFSTALHSSKEFHHASTSRAFGEMTISMLQLLPIFWLFAGRARLRKPDSWLLIGWVGFYLFLIVFIKAGFIARLFLPMLMTPVIFAALGLDRLKLAGRVIVVLIAALNVAIVIYHSSLLTTPPQWLARFIYH
jgi:hypothetical protein